MKGEKKKKLPLGFKIVLGILLFLVALSAFIAYEGLQIAKNLPDPQQSGSWQMTESTKIYDRTGQVLLYEINNQGKRTVLPSDQIPEKIGQATVAIEDQDFYNHSALDFKGIARALLVDLLHGSFSQGGSTITQQLAKNAFLSDQKTITRKIKEIILSYWIEKNYTKDQILTLYLNQIPYGAGADGIEAASQTYFGKDAKDLSLAEIASLVAIPKSPTYYSPWTHLDNLMQRKNLVLDQMHKLGYITEQEMNAAKATTPTFMPQNLGNIKAPHFVMMVKDYLVSKYGEDVVNNGGLKVITSLDWNLQQLAEQAVKNGAARNTSLYGGKNAALVAQDPKTGQILALVGSADYFDKSIDGNFDVATQGLRQPGSSIKPFVYITAFKKGYSPDSVVFNTETNFDTTGQNPYIPQNFEGTFTGPVTLRDALAQSMNVPAVKVLYLTGINDSIQTAHDFGITTLNDPSRYGLTLVLGGGEVKLIDMVNAYSVFAQEGNLHQQSFVLSVQDSNGNTLEQYLDKSTQVIEPQYTRLINDVLSDPIAREPLYGASFNSTLFSDREVALKTGTTNDYRDAWTFGYTPDIVVGVWAGNSDNTPMQKHAGSILAALPIWSDFMHQAVAANLVPNTDSFNRPDPVPESKPMLNGQWNVNGQIHSILYYVDKNDPLGDIPSNPANDPQYNLWEAPVQSWAQQNTSLVNSNKN